MTEYTGDAQGTVANNVPDIDLPFIRPMMSTAGPRFRISRVP